jgi:hypothetical protein
VFNAIFNNISAISLWSVLLVEDAGVAERTTRLSQVTDNSIVYHIFEGLSWS